MTTSFKLSLIAAALVATTLASAGAEAQSRAAPAAGAAAAAGDRAPAQRRAGDVPGCRGLGGAGDSNVLLWECNDDPDHVWSFTRSGELRNALNGTCLDAAGYAGEQGANVDVYRCEALDDQRWQLVAARSRHVRAAQRQARPVPGRQRPGGRARRQRAAVGVRRRRRPALDLRALHAPGARGPQRPLPRRPTGRPDPPPPMPELSPPLPPPPPPRRAARGASRPPDGGGALPRARRARSATRASLTRSSRSSSRRRPGTTSASARSRT